MKRLVQTMTALALVWSGPALAQEPATGLPRGEPKITTPAATTPAALATGQAKTEVSKGEAKGADPAGCMMVWDDQGCHNRRWSFEAGGGVYYIQPNFETNPAFRTSSTVGTTTVNRQQDFRYNMDIAPLGWVGATHECGFGIRGRWFQVNDSASESITATGGVTVSTINAYGLSGATVPPGSRLDVASDLKLDVWDLDLTQTFTCGQWQLLVGGGARYTHMAQGYRSAFLATVGDNRVVLGNHNLNAAGPTFVVEGKRRIGESNLALYGNSRCSILFGSAEAVGRSFSENAQGQQVGTATQNEFFQSDVLPIGEVEVGVEYGRDCGRAHVYVQGGFVGQVWFGGGNASLTNLNGTTTDNSSNFGLVGAAFRVGVSY